MKNKILKRIEIEKLTGNTANSFVNKGQIKLKAPLAPELEVAEVMLPKVKGVKLPQSSTPERTNTVIKRE